MSTLVPTVLSSSVLFGARPLTGTYSSPLKNGDQTNKTVSRSSEAAPLAVRLMEGVLLKLVVSMRLNCGRAKR